MKESRFDLDLQFGKEGERWLTLLADERKIEVKRERDTWLETGNICFEFRCSGKPSGLATTEADYWAHVLSVGGEAQAVLLFRTEHLRERLRALFREGKVKTVCGGDRDAAEMILFPLARVAELLR